MKDEKLLHNFFLRYKGESSEGVDSFSTSAALTVVQVIHLKALQLICYNFYYYE